MKVADRRRWAVVFAAFAGLAGLSVLLGTAGGGDDGSPRSTFSLQAARGIPDFPVYFAGDVVQGVPLVAILRREDAGFTSLRVRNVRRPRRGRVCASGRGAGMAGLYAQPIGVRAESLAGRPAAGPGHRPRRPCRGVRGGPPPRNTDGHVHRRRVRPHGAVRPRPRGRVAWRQRRSRTRRATPRAGSGRPRRVLELHRMTPLAVFAAVSLAGGALGRWWIAAPAASAWTVFLLGLESGWWGSGVGDGWLWMLITGAAVCGASAALGVAARRARSSLSSRALSRRHFG